MLTSCWEIYPVSKRGVLVTWSVPNHRIQSDPISDTHPPSAKSSTTVWVMHVYNNVCHACIQQCVSCMYTTVWVIHVYNSVSHAFIQQCESCMYTSVCVIHVYNGVSHAFIQQCESCMYTTVCVIHVYNGVCDTCIQQCESCMYTTVCVMHVYNFTSKLPCQSRLQFHGAIQTRGRLY